MKKRPNKLLDNIIASQISRARKDIRAWRVAMQQAENVTNPQRILLYNLYDELILDAHLTAEIQRRILAVRGCDFVICDKDGKSYPELTELFQKPWFLELIDLAMESIFYGHSLVEIDELDDGEIQKISLLKRRHVLPEKGLFVKRQGDDKGIPFRDDPFDGWLLEIGKPDDLGLLNKVAPHVLYKRFAQAAWSEYCEVFGMPLRIGKTNTKDDESLNRMESMMINMGAASYAVIDDNESVEFVENNGGKGEVYDGLMEKSNSEISKLVNGAVIGGESKGGSRSKEEVGERIGKSINKADKQFVASFINFTLIPKLIELGYPLDGYKFRFEKTKDIKSLWEITKGVMEHFVVDQKFITETFGIPIISERKKENG